jgi:hypothetical protein
MPKLSGYCRMESFAPQASKKSKTPTQKTVREVGYWIGVTPNLKNCNRDFCSLPSSRRGARMSALHFAPGKWLGDVCSD